MYVYAIMYYVHVCKYVLQTIQLTYSTLASMATKTAEYLHQWNLDIGMHIQEMDKISLEMFSD
jgi:hypothetical protein